jgi:hypothetical protein
MISTDGVGVSILFLRKDLVNKPLPKSKKNTSKELYIDELKNYTDLQDKKIVGVDSGKEDLIYCVDGASKHATTFRYSQDQRRKETKMKKYKNIILAMKNNKIQDKTIIDYETELSHYNKKTLDITKFKEYLQEKNRINHFLFGFYKKELFRKLKFGKYINIKRNEQKMINNFKKTFGKPEEVVKKKQLGRINELSLLNASLFRTINSGKKNIIVMGDFNYDSNDLDHYIEGNLSPEYILHNYNNIACKDIWPMLKKKQLGATGW